MLAYLLEYSTNHPRFIEEVIDGVKRVKAGHTPVLKAYYHILPVLRGISDVLADQNEVWPE